MTRQSKTSMVAIRLMVCKVYCPHQHRGQSVSMTGKHPTATEPPQAWQGLTLKYKDNLHAIMMLNITNRNKELSLHIVG